MQLSFMWKNVNVSQGLDTFSVSYLISYFTFVTVQPATRAKVAAHGRPH